MPLFLTNTAWLTTLDQVVPADSASPVLDDGLAIQEWSILDLLAQAGGFQWPILAVLVIGLMTLALTAVRLFDDKRASRSLRSMSVEYASVEDFKAALKSVKTTLYSSLLSGMFEVWWSTSDPVTIGYESRTTIDGARAAYMRTQRMVGFLSSTAGGLGLLGTLVGIYVLFSAQTRDAQVIFAGIALAIVSTLLGIVVSIILELLEALVHSWASKYLEAAEEWSAEVRYRLLALSKDGSAQ